jgi:hypothetical protein
MLKKVSQSAGGGFWQEGREQELFVDIEVIETDAHHKTGILKVNSSGFKQDPVDNTNKVLKVFQEIFGGKKEEGKCVCESYKLYFGKKVDCAFRKKVIAISKELWPNNYKEMANGLMAVMHRETRGTLASNQLEGYKSLIEKEKMTKDLFEKINSKGERSSRAVGLIQFTQNSLVQMKEFTNGSGFDKLHELKLSYAKMKEVDQLNKVKKYMQSVKSLPIVPEDIYVAVFPPFYVGDNKDTVMYKKGTNDYYSNSALDKDNNGIQIKELLGEFYKSLKEGKNFTNYECENSEKSVNKEEVMSKIVTFDSDLEEDRKKIVSSKTIKILEKAAIASSNDSVIITSTVRSPRKQAEAMYTNENNGKHIAYAAPGREVIKVYNDGKSANLSKESIILNMTNKINELSREGKKVSRHCVSDEDYAICNTIDVSFSKGLKNPRDFINSLTDDSALSTIIHPLSGVISHPKVKYDNQEQAIHIQITQ